MPSIFSQQAQAISHSVRCEAGGDKIRVRWVIMSPAMSRTSIGRARLVNDAGVVVEMVLVPRRLRAHAHAVFGVVIQVVVLVVIVAGKVLQSARGEWEDIVVRLVIARACGKISAGSASQQDGGEAAGTASCAVCCRDPARILTHSPSSLSTAS